MPVETPHPDYTRATSWWARCRDVLEGSDAVKAARETYLPRLGGQTDTEYGAYKLRALFYNGSARTQQALTGTVFRKPAAVQVAEKLKAHLTDITLDDTSLELFALGQLEEVLNLGRVGLLVDLPGEDVRDGDRRPYWVSYRAEQIINWRETRIGGHSALSLVVLKEDVEEAEADGYGVKSVTQYRVLMLESTEASAQPVYTVRLYRQNSANEFVLYQRLVPVRRGQPLPVIPFVITNATSLRARVEKPPLLDLVDVNLSHYRSSADHEHGLHFTALPTPWVVGVTEETELRIGAGVAWVLSGPDAQAGMLEFTGKGMEAIEKNLTMKAELMAVLGARMIEGGASQAETAEAVRSRHAATHATLKTIATTLSAGLTRALQLHAWWMGVTENPADKHTNVALNREFYDARLSADDVKAALLAVQAGQMSFDTFYFILQRGEWTRPEVTAEQEKADIDAALPPEPVDEPPAADLAA